MAIADEPWRHRALSDDDDARIHAVLGRAPSALEVSFFGAVRAGRHDHEQARRLLTLLPTQGPNVMRIPGQPDRAVDLGNGMAAVFRPCHTPDDNATAAREIGTLGARPIGAVFGLGIAPKDRLVRPSTISAGDRLILISATTEPGDPASRDLLTDACLTLHEQRVVVAIRSLGIGGLAAATAEIARLGNVGVQLDLRALSSPDIMLGDRHDHVCALVMPGLADELFGILRGSSLDVTAIGTVTETGRVVVTNGETTLCDVPLHTLVDDAPPLPVDAPPTDTPSDPPVLDLRDVSDIPPQELAPTLQALLAARSLPAGPAGATLSLPENEIIAIATAAGGNARYLELDLYQGSRQAVAEAAQKVAGTGGRPLGLSIRLRPAHATATGPVVRGVSEACRALRLPVISARVDHQVSGPMIACVGVVDDAEILMTHHWRVGDDIWLVGSDEAALGGSALLSTVRGMVAGPAPKVRLDDERNLLQVLQVIAVSGYGAAVRHVGAGGLAVTLATMALESELGAHVATVPEHGRLDRTWFGEGGARAVVALGPQHDDQIRLLCDEWELVCHRIGHVSGADHLRLTKEAVIPLASLRKADPA